MPPPPFPSAPRSRQLPPARVSGLHPDRQPPTYRLQKIDDSQAHTMGVDSSGTATDHEHELEHPFMSDQELAMMSAKSDEAMAEIYRLCEPLLGPPSSIQASPAMALSPALIEELGLGFLFQQADGELQGNWTENQMPNPAQTMEARNAPQKPPPVLSEKQRGKRKECDDGNEHLQDVQLDVEKHERRPRKQVKSVHHATPNPVSTMQAGNVVQQRTPMLPEKQGIKRKEYDGGNEQFQDVQLDVEKHERRPRKQVKSVHHATPQNNNQAQYHETSYIYQPQQHYVPSTDKQVQHHNTPYIYQPQQRYTPSTTDSEVDYTHGKAFGRPALQVVRPVRPPRFASVEDAGPYEEQSRPMTGPNFNQIIRPFNPQQHTASPLGTEFPTLEPSAGPAYTPTPAPTAQISGYQPMGFPPSGPTETPSYGNMQAGQTVWHPSPMPPQMHNWQGLNPQVATTRPRSRANRGQGREPLGTIETNHHYHPYATSKYGNG